MWQNAALFTDDGYNAKVLATMRRLFVVSDFVGNIYFGDKLAKLCFLFFVFKSDARKVTNRASFLFHHFLYKLNSSNKASFKYRLTFNR